MNPNSNPSPTAHLAPESRRFWRQIAVNFELEPHHFALLTLALEAWDRGQQARVALAKAGSLTFEDRFGQPHARPEVAMERDARLSFARLLREIGLDGAATPEVARPPLLRMNRGGSHAS